MKLDNRPKKLLVKGVDEGHTQALRDWSEVLVLPLSIPISGLLICCYNFNVVSLSTGGHIM